MLLRLAGIATLLVAGAVLLGGCGGGDAEDAPAAKESAVELALMRQELERTRARNDALTARVEALRAQLDALAAVEASASGEPEEVDRTDEGGDAEPGVGEEAADQDGDGGEAPGEAWFDARALAEAGLLPDEVERLHEIFDRSEMELIELRHRAAREGYQRTRRFWRELRDLRGGLREDIGDEDFDWLLYASGRDNRVVIRDLLRGSPGERAGLLPGDVVVRYGDSRVFNGRELRDATEIGDFGGRVAVDVLRDGERVRIYVDRGPIGAKLGTARVLPERW